MMLRPAWKNLLLRANLGYKLFAVLSVFLLIHGHTVQAEQIKVEPKQLRNFPVLLQERADVYETAKAKGVGLSCEMEKAASTASTWTDYGALNTWGWTVKPYEPQFDDALDDVFASLSVDISQNVPIAVVHTNAVTINGNEYKISRGEFESVYNVLGGCIVADNSLNPSNAKPGMVRYPLLQKWSDVTFLQWQHMAGVNTPNLNHIIRSTITNPDTGMIMRKALGESSTFNNWDKYAPFESKGKSFYPGSDQYHALLGSPNGQGVAYLLTQHKAQLGVRRVSQITVFGEEGAAAMYLKIDAFTPSI